MTWNDLIARLQEIPENRRNEKACFSSEYNEFGEEIDDLTIQHTDIASNDPANPDFESDADNASGYTLTP